MVPPLPTTARLLALPAPDVAEEALRGAADAEKKPRTTTYYLNGRTIRYDGNEVSEVSAPGAATSGARAAASGSSSGSSPGQRRGSQSRNR